MPAALKGEFPAGFSLGILVGQIGHIESQKFGRIPVWHYSQDRAECCDFSLRGVSHYPVKYVKHGTDYRIFIGTG